MWFKYIVGYDTMTLFDMIQGHKDIVWNSIKTFVDTILQIIKNC